MLFFSKKKKNTTEPRTLQLMSIEGCPQITGCEIIEATYGNVDITERLQNMPFRQRIYLVREVIPEHLLDPEKELRIQWICNLEYSREKYAYTQEKFKSGNEKFRIPLNFTKGKYLLFVLFALNCIEVYMLESIR